MGLSEFVTSVISVAPSALLDYAVIALVLKLPLRLEFRWGLRGLPLALILMAALHTWQRPIAVSGAICLEVVLLARLCQAIAAWAVTLRAQVRPIRRALAARL